MPAPAGAPLAGSSQAPPLPASGSPEHHRSFFSELLDIINPLQHLPVIGTIYRAITGEHVDAFAKIAGDTLYGGVWGAATSVVDVAFEAVTGKSAEDTVLAWFDSSDDGPRVAANLTAPRTGPIIASSLPVLDQPLTIAAADLPTAQQAAFTSALAARGITGEVAQRALYAYQRSVLLTGQPVTTRIN